MNIDGKACNNIPETVNKPALSARLGHSCEDNIAKILPCDKNLELCLE
jgi:hypothetical protein